MVTARSFDLSNDSVKKIVRDAAATQFAIVQVSEDAPVKSEPAATFKYVPPEEAPTPAPTPKRQAPLRQPATPSNDFLSAAFETLLDTALDSALGLGSDYSADGRSGKWLRNASSEPLKSKD